MSQIEEALADAEARADLAEDELTAVRNGIRELQNWLREPVRGPIIFRAEVVERLSEILAL
jgi:hypothetical protein